MMTLAPHAYASFIWEAIRADGIPERGTIRKGRNVASFVTVACGIAGIFSVDSVLLGSVDLLLTPSTLWEETIMDKWMNSEA